jgi:hypothetical protein
LARGTCRRDASQTAAAPALQKHDNRHEKRNDGDEDNQESKHQTREQ